MPQVTPPVAMTLTTVAAVQQQHISTVANVVPVAAEVASNEI